MMRALRDLSFPARVLLAATIPAVLVAVALAWYFTLTRLRDLDGALHERGLVIARQLGPASEYGVFAGNRELLQALAQAAAAEADVDAVSVMDARGQALAIVGQALRPPTLPTVVQAQLVAHDEKHLIFAAPVKSMQTRGDELMEAMAGPAAMESTPIGAVFVQISRERLQRTALELGASAALITLVGLLLAGWVARLLSRGVTAPVLELAATVAEIERGNLKVRANTEARGELKILERGINDMAASLNSSRADLERRISEATAQLQAQKERAEAATRTKTEFLAAASHDLRQPLQALGLFANSLRQRVSDVQAHELITRMERGVASMEAVLDALLDISRLDAGVIEPRLEDFPLARLFDSLQADFSALAERHRLRLRFVPTRAWVRSDPQLLERIVSNLLSNALRYTLRGGVVVGCRRAAASLRVEVWDSGRGIAAEKLQDIFREFVQVGPHERGRDKGLGLGLAIVERLGRLLHHRVAARSWPGRGSVFSVTVPRAAASVHASADAAAANGGQVLRGRCVVVIDDDPEVLDALQGLLAASGVAVVAAAGADDALRALHTRGQRPDAMVTDYRLALETTGLDAIALFHSHYGRALPAIVITGESSPSTLGRLAESGVQVLHKPVRAAQIVATLARLLDRAGVGNHDG